MVGQLEVAENTARVEGLMFREAVDGDDEIGGYGIAGGADGGLFAVEAGELLFREAPDYETPGDVAGVTIPRADRQAETTNTL